MVKITKFIFFIFKYCFFWTCREEKNLFCTNEKAKFMFLNMSETFLLWHETNAVLVSIRSYNILTTDMTDNRVTFRLNKGCANQTTATEHSLESMWLGIIIREWWHIILQLFQNNETVWHLYKMGKSLCF